MRRAKSENLTDSSPCLHFDLRGASPMSEFTLVPSFVRTIPFLAAPVQAVNYPPILPVLAPIKKIIKSHTHTHKIHMCLNESKDRIPQFLSYYRFVSFIWLFWLLNK